MIDLIGQAQVSNAWWYVGVAYTVILGGMAFYIAWLRVRLRRAHRELSQLS